MDHVGATNSDSYDTISTSRIPNPSTSVSSPWFTRSLSAKDDNRNNDVRRTPFVVHRRACSLSSIHFRTTQHGQDEYCPRCLEGITGRRHDIAPTFSLSSLSHPGTGVGRTTRRRRLPTTLYHHEQRQSSWTFPAA